MLTVDPHPLLDLRALSIRFPRPLGELDESPALSSLLSASAAAPVHRSEETRALSRKLLRHGGYRPSGRSKPASEYLVKAAEGGFLGPINAAVDLGNAVSLHSGLPISVVDRRRIEDPLRITIGVPGESYVFNASGHVLDCKHLLVLADAGGPCANAVKDSQRTKTDPDTTEVLVLFWAHVELAEQAAAATAWMGELATSLGAAVTKVEQT
jgi:DNA/RNA-binding domain of Phe-tRNA-synthetase-like protein